MADVQYPGNSNAPHHSQQPEQTSLKHTNGPVISGGATTREKRWIDKVRTFFGLDNAHTFKDYIDFTADMTNRVYGAVDMLTGNRRGPNAPTVPGARIAYSSYYQAQQPPQQHQNNAQQRLMAAYSYDDIIYSTKGDAEITLEKMFELLQQYQAVSIADLFDLSGLTSPNGYTDHKYGWTNLQSACVVRVNGGYMLRLPRAEQL